MYSTINIEALERCIRNNELAPDFDLSRWFHPCGTYGCLVGNDLIATGRFAFDPTESDPLGRVGCYSEPSKIVALSDREYGVPRMSHFYLFAGHNYFDSDGVFTAYSSIIGPAPGGTFRDCKDRDAALNRLRKYVAYVRRKKAIWYDAEGRVREEARRTEGDLNILRSVASELSPLSLSTAV